MKDLRDNNINFSQLTHCYSDFVFYFLRKYKNEINTNMTVLDAGCGHGRNLRLFYSLGFKNLIGLDIIKRQEHNTFKYIELNLETCKIDKKYDIVLCNFVLMFIENQIEVVEKLINSTNKFLIIETNSLDGQYNYSCYIQNIYYYILGFRKDVKIIYYSKNYERIILKKWQKNIQTDI